jgi:putative ABC transport system ATP-binding protein
LLTLWFDFPGARNNRAERLPGQEKRLSVQLLETHSLVFPVRGNERSRPATLLLPDNRVIWVKGRSGEGKTTLLRTIARLIPFLEGDLLLEDVSWKNIPAVDWRARVAYFHQKPVVFPGTALANLERPFSFHSRRRQSLDVARARDLLDGLLLPKDILSRDALTLSVGEASRVALVRGLMTDPQVLLLDEPTAALDPKSGEALAATLQEWLSTGRRGIIAVAHDKEVIQMLPGEEIFLGASSNWD